MKSFLNWYRYEIAKGLTEIERVANIGAYVSKLKSFELESHGVLIRYFG